MWKKAHRFVGGGCMTILFLGYVHSQRSGCSACGKRRTANTALKRDKRMTLPSGRVMTFYAGQQYEVNNAEGAFLLNQMDETGRYVFKEVV